MERRRFRRRDTGHSRWEAFLRTLPERREQTRPPARSSGRSRFTEAPTPARRRLPTEWSSSKAPSPTSSHSTRTPERSSGRPRRAARGAPSVRANGIVYASAYSGQWNAYKETDGTLLWSVTNNDGCFGPCTNTIPVVSGGMLYLAAGGATGLSTCALTGRAILPDFRLLTSESD